MTDLAKRPRGGWQVGGGIKRRSALDNFTWTDGFGVDWGKGDDHTAIEVRHYGIEAQPDRVCCRVTVRITDEDRTHATDYEKTKGATAALERAGALIEAKHKARRSRPGRADRSDVPGG